MGGVEFETRPQRRRVGAGRSSQPTRLSAALTEQSALVAPKSSDLRWSRAMRSDWAASSGGRRPSASVTSSATASG